MATIAGSWQGAVTVTSAEGSGVLFEAAQFQPPLAPSISLAEPGPRACPRLWTALLEALMFVDGAVSGCGGVNACMQA